MMKKFICILLLSWLPVFMLASNAMAMQMALNNTHQMPATEMQHACHESKNEATATHSKAHQCVVCTMCVLSHAVAFTSAANSVSQSLHHPQPLFDEARFSSLDSPPALKPPKLS